MNVVLSSYPLTQRSLQALSAAQNTRTLTLNELRTLPVRDLLAHMRSVRPPKLTVVVQDPSERSLLALMLALAALSRAQQLEINDLAAETLTPISRIRAALGILGAIAATISGKWCILYLERLGKSLMQAQSIDFGKLRSRRALYLQSNLMLGVKAGGSIGHIAGVANELLRIDQSMCFLAPEPPPMVKSQARFVPIEPLSTYGVPAEVNHFRFNDRCVAAASPVLAREMFGFIYQRLSLGNLSGVLLSRRHKVPLILEYNGSEVWVSDNWGHRLKYRALASLVEDVCLRHAHRVVTVSQVLADELRERGVPAERIVWYPNCIDPEVFDPTRLDGVRATMRDRLGLAPDELAVLFLGTFGIWHGAETLAETVRQYCARGHGQESGQPRLRFVFVGDGLRLPAVRALLVDEAARGDVIFTGLVPQAEAPAYLAAADIFVSPHVPSTDGSKFFGSPTKLFEYMAMERPIIASDLDQLGDVLRPGLSEHELSQGVQPQGDEIAILTEPGSAEAMLRALLALRGQPELRRSLAIAARQRALDAYTWERHVQAIMDSLN